MRIFSPTAISLTILTALMAATDFASARTWTDRSGKFQVEADLVEILGDVVVLKKANGKVVKTPISEFSDKDRRYLAAIRQQQSRRTNVAKQNAVKPQGKAAPNDGPANDGAAADLRREAEANARDALTITPAKTIKAEFSMTVRAPDLRERVDPLCGVAAAVGAAKDQRQPGSLGNGRGRLG